MTSIRCACDFNHKQRILLDQHAPRKSRSCRLISTQSGYQRGTEERKEGREPLEPNQAEPYIESKPTLSHLCVCQQSTMYSTVSATQPLRASHVPAYRQLDKGFPAHPSRTQHSHQPVVLPYQSSISAAAAATATQCPLHVTSVGNLATKWSQELHQIEIASGTPFTSFAGSSRHG